MIAISFVIVGIFTMLVYYVNDILTLLFTQIFVGIGRGLLNPLLMSLSIKHIESSKTGTAMGFYQAIYGLGMFIGPILMGTLADWLSLKFGFIVIGAFGIIAAVFSKVILKIVMDDNKKYIN